MFYGHIRVPCGVNTNAPPTLSAAGRSMGHQQTVFIRQKFDDLEKLGLVKPVTNPVYVTPALVVKKKGPKN